MIESFIPPDEWFEVADDIISKAKSRITIADFKISAKLKPFKIKGSYSYRQDVLGQLLKMGVIVRQNEVLTLGNTQNVEWLEKLLTSGYSKAWNFVEKVDGHVDELKKFDPVTLKMIGDAGELYVIEELKSSLPVELHSCINHVAQKNDALGYDIIAPSVLDTDKTVILEVKTTTVKNKNGIQFFLSRNEFEVGQKNRNWSIIFVTITDSVKSVLGHIYCYQFESKIPREVDKNVLWQSCKIYIETSAIRPGIP